MAATEVELKSPFVPLFQRGNFLRAILTPLCQRGEGEIFRRNDSRIMSRTSGTGHYLDDSADARYVLLSKIGLLATNLTVSTVTS